MTKEGSMPVTRIFITKIEDDDSPKKYMVLRENPQNPESLETTCLVDSQDGKGKAVYAKFNGHGSRYSTKELYHFLKDPNRRYDIHYCPPRVERDVNHVLNEYGWMVKTKRDKKLAQDAAAAAAAEEARKKHAEAIKQGTHKLNADSLIHELRNHEL
jgi:hypothetical protein